MATLLLTDLSAAPSENRTGMGLNTCPSESLLVLTVVPILTVMSYEHAHLSI